MTRLKVVAAFLLLSTAAPMFAAGPCRMSTRDPHANSHDCCKTGLRCAPAACCTFMATAEPAVTRVLLAAVSPPAVHMDAPHAVAGDRQSAVLAVRGREHSPPGPSALRI